MTLTVKAVDAARPREKAYKLADAHGLYLYVSPKGAKSWRANYTEAGKQKTRTYGLYPRVSLAEARKTHLAGREEAPARKLAPTFETVMRDWLKAKLPTLSNGKHQIQVANTLERYALPFLGKLSIDEIPRSELVKVVRAAQAGGKIETGHRVASRISAVFDYAQDTGLIEQHGAAGLTRVLVARKTKKPMSSIPPEEAGGLMRAIDGYDDSVTRLGLLLLAHTFVRVGELRGMLWGELKEGGAVWVVPETRMKMRMPHVVPLSRQAQSILAKLREMSGDGALVLDSPIHPGHPLSENTFLFALYRLGYRGRMTAHGFRALASTVLNERSGFPHDVIERQLAHKETDAVRAAYNRAEYLTQRRELMQWWSNWLEAAQSRSD
ncbi:integrase arm-type DNA-binding domain-containing protein [Variovorax sp. NFACC27]|uniref:tyrosine-type recombinase/integrase n=1 Tax=unclassified Variovorax TaxID=663243 RepID=UPI00089D4ED7|nr:Integrase [Variovorax sp. NFACC28]SEG85976.1 Integrase [Variovorax sp. NFACC29]SFD22508.1 Integrase [Variovorax sp. NFACC26]SFG29328.1 Integrase [Variovorax sp. NFACC27]